MDLIWKYGAIPLAILLVVIMKSLFGRIRSRRANPSVREAEKYGFMAKTNDSNQRPILATRGFPSNGVIVNEARWFSLDAVYLVIVQPRLIAAACVGGQMVLGQTFGLLSPSNPLALTSADRLIPALAVDPGGEAFLALDKRNFCITPEDVSVIRYSRRRALWTVGVKNSGTLRIALPGGRRRNLILLGRQDLHVLIKQLGEAGFPVEKP